ncbi:ParB/RepB/Spo0J family partition protein [Weissella cibaria]|uniref:ParB/RepB/Spo0J family partition protein n=1 Tax=Weissella cibaria TaxID=137591 RepID=UPI001D05B10E|nr:ParB/RepB/Spo0J family partition protein [Weissella cibaria]MCB5826969.1 ParB/RepB/Spo0J family partition protein [Weissella cibaria]MCB5858550.1 ParB/RepB/Spo0J family partition protein [Weissella cibaria]MCB5860759.1 ParB/RepB/Spo0J family partition protein [Weissella cibaria]MCB5862375.1 ParB/RepB/Spo0J family partition protein [Weissella cibaria]MCB5865276.1 ParB/RepB/Spo0J family partition protein [Weissella cibaria]
MIDINLVEKTEETKNLIIKCKTQLFPVVRIPLTELQYNKLNGRIATWISEYLSDKDSFPNNPQEANMIIEGFIQSSNSESLKKTKNNIELFEQQEAAVVLKNGVIVDGNRRFTALRQLSREGKGQKFNYIKAVLLDSEDYTPKEIKTLELNLQHAKEERVDYDPIDRLVDIYRDLISDDSPFTAAEYAREVDSTEKAVLQDMEVAQLMIDYLKYIGQPLMFHIARQQKLDGPLREAQRILKSKKIDEQDYKDARDIIFASIASFDGDVTRKVRDMKNVVQDSKMLSDVIEELDNTLDKMDKNFRQQDVAKAAKETHTVNVPTEQKTKVIEVATKYTERKKLSSAQKAPIESLKKSLDRINDVDTEAVVRMSADDIEEFSEYLDRIQERVNAMKGLTNAD